MWSTLIRGYDISRMNRVDTQGNQPVGLAGPRVSRLSRGRAGVDPGARGSQYSESANGPRNQTLRPTGPAGPPPNNQFQPGPRARSRVCT